MFERYTQHARRTIFFARYEASHRGSRSIEEEHMLLAFAREDKLLFTRILPAERSVAQLVGDIEALCRQDPAEMKASVEIPFSQGVRQALADSAGEAERLRDRHIGVEHLLLGVLKQNPERLKALLERYRLTPEHVVESLGKPGPGTWQHRSSAAALADVQRQFLSWTERLTPDIQPAHIYKP